MKFPLIFLLFLPAFLNYPAEASETADQIAANAEQTIEHAGHRGDATALAEAIKSIDAALLVTPDQPALLYTRAYAPYVASFLRPDPKSQVTAEKQLRDAAGLLERVKGAPWEIEAAALRGAILGSLIHLQKNPAQAGATLGPESSRLLAEAEVAAPTNPRLLIFRGQSLLFTPAEYGGNPEEGVALLKMSVEQFDHAPSATGPRWGHAEALAWLGFAMQKTGDLKAARAAWEQALAVDPDYAWVKYALLPSLAQSTSKP